MPTDGRKGNDQPTLLLLEETLHRLHTSSLGRCSSSSARSRATSIGGEGDRHEAENTKRHLIPSQRLYQRIVKSIECPPAKRTTPCANDIKLQESKDKAIGQTAGKGNIDIIQPYHKEIILEFKREVEEWKAIEESQNINDRDQWKEEPTSRQAFADHLTDKYLCRLLDPVPKSVAVSGLRKHIAYEIDQFSNSAAAAVASQQTAWHCALCTKQNQPDTVICVICGRSREHSDDIVRKNNQKEQSRREGKGAGPSSILTSPSLRSRLEQFGKATLKSKGDIQKCEKLGDEIRAALTDIRMVKPAEDNLH